MATRRGADNRQERRQHRIDAGTERAFLVARRSRSKASRRKQFLALTAPGRRAWYLNLAESFFASTDHDEQQTVKATIREECGVQPYDFVHAGDPVIDCRSAGPHRRARNATYDPEHLYLYPAPRYDQFGPPHFTSTQGIQIRFKNTVDETETEFFFRIPIKATKQNTDLEQPYAGAVLQLTANDDANTKKDEHGDDDNSPTHALTIHTLARDFKRATGFLTGTLLKIR